MNKSNIILHSHTLDILVGCLLGDAHIGKSGSGMAFITFEQTDKHKDYVFDLYPKLKGTGLDLSELKYYFRKYSRYNSINNSIYFKSRNYEVLYPLAEMFLSSDNKKVLPKDIEKYLNPIALAYWICDDGQLVKRGGITLCTDNYTLSEIKLLIKALYNRYNIECSIHKKKGKAEKIYNRIYIKKNYFEKIKPLLIEHVQKSFLYKLQI